MSFEIYNDIATHDRFARDQQEIEDFQRQYHVPPSGAGIVAVQTKILDFVPKHPAIVMLMQTYQRKLWARFMIPKNFYLQRYSSSYVAPSLGPKEKQEADINRIEAYLSTRTKGRFVRKEKEEREKQKEEKEGRQKKEEEEMVEEGEVIMNLLEKGVKESNEMVDFIIARMHQFVQA